MTTVEVEQVPIDGVDEDLSRAREVVALARSDTHTAIRAHTTLLTIEALAQQVAQVEQQIRTERDQWTDWIRTTVDQAQALANEHDWCGVFDSYMTRVGLPPRIRNVDIDWRCTLTLSGEVGDESIVALVRNMTGRSAADITVTDSAAATVTYTVTGTTEGPDGECICDSIDTEDIRANLPDWAEEWTIENEGTVYCDNDQ